jgi:hypothetical protein
MLTRCQVNDLDIAIGISCMVEAFRSLCHSERYAFPVTGSFFIRAV